MAFGDGSSGEDVVVAVERPAMLYTCVRWSSGPRKGKSIAHRNHPMVALVHLLASADVGPDVFMSAPFLSDFAVIDQLCHYADPKTSGLNIHILLGPIFWNKSNLQDFVGYYENRRQAVARLHIKDCGRDSKYFHTKAVVTTAGMMIGSYNYTKASREDHNEHAMLCGPNFYAIDGLGQELSQEWSRLGPEIVIPKMIRETTATTQDESGSISNPYARKNKNKQIITYSRDHTYKVKIQNSLSQIHGVVVTSLLVFIALSAISLYYADHAFQRDAQPAN